MLAASYGVAMARHVESRDQTIVRTALPAYARGLYKAMFTEAAPFSTTHCLMREYGYRVLEIAAMHDATLFSADELERCKLPFPDGGLREWQEAETTEEEFHGLDSPFRMDFENYTLGRLVPDRRNYDFTHEGYRRVRAQVLWRVKQFGWSSELFGSVDSSIENQQQSQRVERGVKKIDRYGKKYSWIALFEMAGLLHDRGTPQTWLARDSYVDIDPSFPESATKERVISSDFLGDVNVDTEEWIAGGALPDVHPYLRLDGLQSEGGQWVALDGIVAQGDEARGRSLFCEIRSLLVANRDANLFVNHLSKQDLGGRWLPDKPEVAHIYAGEIPWCNTFPANGMSEISFVIKEETVTVEKAHPEYYLDGKNLGWSEFDLFRRRVFGAEPEPAEELQHISDEDLERIEVREALREVEEVQREYVKFDVLIPVCNFAWESHRTMASDAVHATTLAKEIASALELVAQPQTLDLFRKDGTKATYNISDQSDDYSNHQSMFLIREDLLRSYLRENDLALVWAIWGEREYSLNRAYKLLQEPDHAGQTRSVYSLVKRYEWPN